MNCGDDGLMIVRVELFTMSGCTVVLRHRGDIW